MHFRGDDHQDFANGWVISEHSGCKQLNHKTETWCFLEPKVWVEKSLKHTYVTVGGKECKTGKGLTKTCDPPAAHQDYMGMYFMC